MARAKADEELSRGNHSAQATIEVSMVEKSWVDIGWFSVALNTVHVHQAIGIWRQRTYGNIETFAKYSSSQL